MNQQGGRGLPPTSAETLSSRELEIVRLLSDGLTNREIAQTLFLSPETIKWYNKQLYSKLGVRSRTQAVARAREMGLLERVETGSPPVRLDSYPHLPAEITSFVGRKSEVAEIGQLLRGARLITLTGAGGSGKTRLGLRVAALAVPDFADGVYFVSLAPISGPALVAGAIARALGVSERPGRPLTESLSRFLRDKHALLVVDNCEHVLDAAPLLTDLLAAAPGLTVLATSRETLHLSGEQSYPVSPLPVPREAQDTALSDLSANESIDLFVQRARAASPDFRLTEENAADVVAICVRLDGLPLAIELAAARTRLLSPTHLLERLQQRFQLLTGGARDLPARQRTLLATLDWSYELLENPERRLLARMSTFAGGRSLTAIEAVCGPGLSIDTLDGVQSLLDKSLVYEEGSPAGEPRFYMLESIHNYAADRLGEMGEAGAIQDQHLAYFVSLAESLEQGFRRHGQIHRMKQAEAEIGNWRLALDHALDTSQIEAAARLMAALDYYFRYGDRLVEGYRRFVMILERVEQVPVGTRSRFLLGAARSAWINGHLAKCEALSCEGLELAEELHEATTAAWHHIELAAVCGSYPARVVEGKAEAKTALATFTLLNDGPGTAEAYNILGELARADSDYPLAQEMYRACRDKSRENGELTRAGMQEGNLGYVAYHMGQYDNALDYSLAQLQSAIDLGWVHAKADSLWGIAGPLARLGRPRAAARLAGASARNMSERGLISHPTDLHELEVYLADIRSDLPPVEFEALYAEGEALSLDEAVAYALEVC